MHINHRFQTKVKFLTHTILFNFLNSNFRFFFNLLKKIDESQYSILYTNTWVLYKKSTSWPSMKTARKVPFHSSHSNGNILSTVTFPTGLSWPHPSHTLLPVFYSLCMLLVNYKNIFGWSFLLYIWNICCCIMACYLLLLLICQFLSCPFFNLWLPFWPWFLEVFTNFFFFFYHKYFRILILVLVG